MYISYIDLMVDLYSILFLNLIIFISVINFYILISICLVF